MLIEAPRAIRNRIRRRQRAERLRRKNHAWWNSVKNGAYHAFVYMGLFLFHLVALSIATSALLAVSIHVLTPLALFIMDNIVVILEAVIATGGVVFASVGLMAVYNVYMERRRNLAAAERQRERDRRRAERHGRQKRECVVCDTNFDLQWHECGSYVCYKCSGRWTKTKPGAQSWACCGAHRPLAAMTREEQTRVMALNKRKKEKIDANLVQYCPTCNMGVTKIMNCNQLMCPECGTNFCWLCGTRTNYGQHHCVNNLKGWWA